MKQIEYTLTHTSYYRDKLKEIIEWINNRGYDASLLRYSRYKGYIEDFYKGNLENLNDLSKRFKKLNEAFQECFQIVQIYEVFRDENSEGFANRLEKVVYGNDFYNNEKKSDQTRDFLYKLLVASGLRDVVILLILID